MQECPRCRTLASDKAERCPACGFYFHEEDSVAGVQEALPAAVALKLVNYAGFWRRLGAFAVDVFVLSATVGGSTLIFQKIYLSARGFDRLPRELALLVGFIEILLAWLYYAVMESSRWQATLGKQASGIIVTDYRGNRISFARASGRYFGKYLSVSTLYIGFLMVAFTKKKQGLHDMMAGCLVVNKKLYPANLAAQIEGQPVQGTAEMTAIPLESQPQVAIALPLEATANPFTGGRMPAKFCPRCGTATAEGANFCGRCGASLTQ